MAVCPKKGGIKEMKKYISRAAAIIMAVALLFAAAGCGPSNAGKEAAKVNDTVITCGQVDKYATIMYFTNGYDVSEVTDDVKSETLDTMVEREVIRQYYEENNIDIYDDDYDSGKDAFVESFKENEENFLKESDVTEEDLIDYYRSTFVSQHFYADIAAEYSAEAIDQAAQDYFNENKENYAVGDQKRISVMILGSQEDADAAKADAASGADFSQLASERSIDEETASRGGDLGFFTKPEIDSAYGEGIFELPVGAVSEPVQIDKGFAVIKITDENTSGYENFDAIKDEIMYMIYSQRFAERVDEIKAGMDISVTGLA